MKNYHHKMLTLATESVSSTGPTAPSQSIKIRTPTNPAAVHVEGFKLADVPSDMQSISEKLAECGLEIDIIMYVGDDSTEESKMAYCTTIHGQKVLVELPDGIKDDLGELKIGIQRVDVIQSNLLEMFESSLAEDIYTGYAISVVFE